MQVAFERSTALLRALDICQISASDARNMMEIYNIGKGEVRP